jgi:hypothetical protein
LVLSDFTAVGAIRGACRSRAAFGSAGQLQPQRALGAQNVQFQLELHVNGANPAAADTNSGSAQQPFKTLVRGIKAAFEAQAAGKSVRLRVHPGTYREEYDEPFRWGTLDEVKPFSPTEPRVLIEAVRPRSVVMTGADVFSDWKPADNGLFTHEWTRNMREVVQTKTDWPWYHPLFGRAEGVIINGKIVRQVYERSQLKPDRFWVDDNANQVLLWPSAGVDPRTAKVEMITRHKLFQVWWKRGLTIRGIDFVHAGSVLTGNSTYVTSVLFAMGADVTLEDCRFDGNAAGAVNFLNFRDVTVRNCTANDNGFGGMGFGFITNVRVENSETSEITGAVAKACPLAGPVLHCVPGFVEIFWCAIMWHMATTCSRFTSTPTALAC